MKAKNSCIQLFAIYIVSSCLSFSNRTPQFLRLVSLLTSNEADQVLVGTKHLEKIVTVKKKDIKGIFEKTYWNKTI